MKRKISFTSTAAPTTNDTGLGVTDEMTGEVVESTSQFMDEIELLKVDKGTQIDLHTPDYISPFGTSIAMIWGKDRYDGLCHA